MIYFKNLIKKFGSTIALNGITFEVGSNEFIGIIGNNGSGKTTLLNALCNLIQLDSGEISFTGEKLTAKHHSYKKGLGVILSDHYFIEEFTIVEYLRFFSKFQGVQDNVISSRIKDVIDLLEIPNKNVAIGKLSSGSKMKVAIAASLIHNPKVLIYDEPFVNLDINTSDKLKEILRSLKGKKTLVITSHNLELVVDICDRLLILDEGKVIEDFKKTEHDSIDELKEKIKYKMVRKNLQKKIEWLN